MPTRLHSLLAATLFAASLSAATSNHAPVACPAGQTPPWEPVNARGASRASVLDVLGSPSEALNANVWVYFNYRVEIRRSVTPSPRSRSSSLRLLRSRRIEKEKD